MINDGDGVNMFMLYINTNIFVKCLSNQIFFTKEKCKETNLK